MLQARNLDGNSIRSIAAKTGCITHGKKAAIIKELREKGYRLKYLLVAMNMPKSTYFHEMKKKDAVAERNIQKRNIIPTLVSLEKLPTM